MSIKDNISKSYMDAQKFRHAAKPLATHRKAIIVGAEFGNIGDEILKRLRYDFEIEAPAIEDFDVTKGTGQYFMVRHEYDTLIMCNGFTHLDWFEDMSPTLIQKTFDVNVVGSLKAAQKFVNCTINQAHKKYIVFIGSMAYNHVLNGSVAYCASKAALAHATKCLAWELAPKGFNVFCVHPSNVEGTPMTEETIKGLMRYRYLSRSEAEEYWGASLPKEKWLQPADIAETVAFLISGKADYLSGSNIEMAGGQR